MLEPTHKYHGVMSYLLVSTILIHNIRLLTVKRGLYKSSKDGQISFGFNKLQVTVLNGF